MAEKIDPLKALLNNRKSVSYDATQGRSADELSPIGQAVMNAAVREANMMDAIEAGHDPFELLKARDKVDAVVAKLDGKYAMQERDGGNVLTAKGEADLLRMVTHCPEQVRAVLAEHDKRQSREIDPRTVATLNAAEDRKAEHGSNIRAMGNPDKEVEDVTRNLGEPSAIGHRQTARGERLEHAITAAVRENSGQPGTGAYNRPAVDLLAKPIALTPSAKAAAVVDKLARKYREQER